MPANELKGLEVKFVNLLPMLFLSSHCSEQEQDRDAYDKIGKHVISRIYNVACRAKQDTFNVSFLFMPN